ncbi:hypothetical protein FB451DRAFT_1184088 [Mycena latifolia]|nr:hypothetical protein FB451DRAFT_1184088 [Mycena latifolia]
MQDSAKKWKSTWNRPVMRPRTSLGLHSETNAENNAQIPPMPIPVITRPEYISAKPPCPPATVVLTAPTRKMTENPSSVYLRPILAGYEPVMQCGDHPEAGEPTGQRSAPQSSEEGACLQYRHYIRRKDGIGAVREFSGTLVSLPEVLQLNCGYNPSRRLTGAWASSCGQNGRIKAEKTRRQLARVKEDVHHVSQDSQPRAKRLVISGKSDRTPLVTTGLDHRAEACEADFLVIIQTPLLVLPRSSPNLHQSGTS